MEISDRVIKISGSEKCFLCRENSAMWRIERGEKYLLLCSKCFLRLLCVRAELYALDE